MNKPHLNHLSVRALVAFLTLLLAGTRIHCDALAQLSPKSNDKILVVGASGGTGVRALRGLLDVGYSPCQIRILTRNPDKPHLVALRELGFETCQADLEDAASLLPSSLLEDCVGCYIHSTSSDTAKLDTLEVDRAKNLAAAIQAHQQSQPKHPLQSIVYNSAAAEEDHGVYRMAQKHGVEQILKDVAVAARHTTSSNIQVTSLRANLFMEEFWKHYTRPAIQKGTFPLSVPSDRPIYLTSVRDMGRLAGTIIQKQQEKDQTNENVRTINVASQVMTPFQMAEAFGKSQDTPCRHAKSRMFALLVRLFFKDLHEVIQFYRTSEETTDIAALKQQFPDVSLTPFDTFLSETKWGHSDLTYDDLCDVTDLVPTSQVVDEDAEAALQKETWESASSILDNWVSKIGKELGLQQVSEKDLPKTAREWHVGDFSGTLQAWKSPSLVPWATRYTLSAPMLQSVGFNVFLNPKSDTPHLTVFVGLQGSRLIVMGDHIPRRDLLLDQQYATKHYGGERALCWSELRRRPGVVPFVSLDPTVRAVQSPNFLALQADVTSDNDKGISALMEALEEHCRNWLAFIVESDTFAADGTGFESMASRDLLIREVLRDHEKAAGVNIFGEEHATFLANAMGGFLQSTEENDPSIMVSK